MDVDPLLNHGLGGIELSAELNVPRIKGMQDLPLDHGCCQVSTLHEIFGYSLTCSKAKSERGLGV
jgi:hypothetical protein